MPKRRKLKRVQSGPIDSFFKRIDSAPEEDDRRRKISISSSLHPEPVPSPGDGDGVEACTEDSAPVVGSVPTPVPSSAGTAGGTPDAGRPEAEIMSGQASAAGTLPPCATAGGGPPSASDTEEMEEAVHVHYQMHLHADERPEHWDNARLPCSLKNTYYDSGTRSNKSRWDLIVSVLKKDIPNTQALVDAILEINPTRRGTWNFTNLVLYLDRLPPVEAREFFNTTLPGMQRIAMKLPDLLPEGLPLLRQGSAATVSISREQVASLLANAFFCDFPRAPAGYPGVNFHSLFALPSDGDLRRRAEGKMQAKLRCVLHYFHCVVAACPAGVLSFHRNVLVDFPVWPMSQATLCDVEVKKNECIEDAEESAVRVDFANKVIGGGVLATGCVQEEIMMLTHCELIAARFIVESLDDHEALAVRGALRFSVTAGYADTFAWKRSCFNATEGKLAAVVAIDSINFKRDASYGAQFGLRAVERELNKAYCGFSSKDPHVSVNASASRRRLATGHWGCGAFDGDKQLKFFVQLLAASQCDHDLIYHAFGDEEALKATLKVSRALAKDGATVGRLFCLLRAALADMVTDGRSLCDLIAAAAERNSAGS